MIEKKRESYERKKSTCKGCSSLNIFLSAARSQLLGGDKPVSDSLIPLIFINIIDEVVWKIFVKFCDKQSYKEEMK